MRKLFLLLFLNFFGFAAFAQSGGERISGLFAQMNFERFANTVENQTSYEFHFRQKDVADVRVNLQLSDASLPNALDEIFSGTNLKYTIDGELGVWISSESRMQMNFSPQFFEIKERSDDETSIVDSVDRFARNKLYTIGRSTDDPEKSSATISGIVTSIENGEPMEGAIVLERVNYNQMVTGPDGYYELTLPKGRHTLVVQNIGGFQEQRQINLLGDGKLNMRIAETVLSLDEVVVSSGALSNIQKLDMGVQAISIDEVKRLPAVLGEVDLVRGILTTPGVNTVGEASVGFNVRGGAADQNLILYNQSTVFNPSHVFGFFSAFNADLTSGVELYKGSIPVNYGGRLSSVLQIDADFGNEEKFSGSGGIGLLTGRLSLEGPISENTTFKIGGRATYSDWVLNLLEDETDLNGSDVSFYDLNANIRHEIDEKNILEFTGYLSQDDFSFDPDTTFNYRNFNVAGTWRHFFNDQLEGSFTFGYDSYEFGIIGIENPLNSFDFSFEVEQFHLRSDFEYRKNENHIFKFGFHAIQYDLDPGTIQPFGPESILIEQDLERERAREFSIYFGDEFTINEELSISYGGRYMFYNMYGQQTINEYVPGAPITDSNVIGERSFGSGESVKTYHGPEFRVSARYILDNQSSLKAGFNTNRQNLHLLTNTSAIAPTDSWKLSDTYIKPQTGGQASLGYYRNLARGQVEFSAEVYYRYMRNLLDFRSGATLILNENIEQDVLNSDGRAYGIEFLLKKNVGDLRGSLAYTFSRSFLKTSDDPSIEKVNNGEFYPSNYDQPHNVVLALNYELSKRINTTLNTNYSTGRPVTLPISKFEYAGSERVFFSERNAYRIPDYFRIDFSVNLEGNHKVNKVAHASWSFGVYNLLGRSNPYSVYYTPIEGEIKGFQLSIFARPIPFITYNFRF
ncbi:TonB-dependent receptor [Algoriphagus sediminis]|uniref:TonB-dependent receptor n=1 Tax=Algoriphagus sediminis TaxID=3057113 RepID=A0ABT7YG22_9BACT|nr:TonB-dependent receptor [Algoriphagus sediminis]MDN3205437.1 TonB-dependent receptor [Algoriphagus sediminis]